VSVFPVTVTDDGPMLRATVTLPGCTPARALAAFTEPTVLARWWTGGDLVTTLEPGGLYTIGFPRLNRAITGEVVSYIPAARAEHPEGWLFFLPRLAALLSP
jgi:uncharacterized protein YndB with AHSA1/START domain